MRDLFPPPPVRIAQIPLRTKMIQILRRIWIRLHQGETAEKQEKIALIDVLLKIYFRLAQEEFINWA